MVKVIVVGAGMAGIAAAKRLKENGFDVVVLEARDRIGGRMNTSTNPSGTTIDLGAAWIHGDWAEFEALVAGMNLATVNTDFTLMTYFRAAGVAPAVLTPQIFNDLASRLENAVVWNALFSPYATMKSVIDAAYFTGGFYPYPQDLVNSFTTAAIDTEYANSASKIPAVSASEFVPNLSDTTGWASFLNSSEGDNTAFPGGYSQVAANLAVGLDIHLSEPISTINYSGSQVTVTTSAATYTADHVIVTVPIGVLKAHTITFVPALPTAKANAITRLGSGLLNKVFLEFPTGTQFWPADRAVIETNSPTRGAFSTFINLQPITAKPILQGWLVGDAAIEREGWTDAQIIAEAMTRLRACVSSSAPDPISVKITRWGQDPYARGSYSTFNMSTLLGDRALLREPVASNKILFAGEATMDTGFAQVPGAYASGKREADRLIATYAP